MKPKAEWIELLMDYTFDVTIIIATFRPDIRKTLFTLKGCLIQENIDIEIIISDDGSEYSFSEVWKDFFYKNGFEEYTIIENKTNIGTVRNFLNAAGEARGRYIFCTSPGDVLYDKNALARLYNNALTNNCEVCFANAIYYRCHEQSIKIISDNNKKAILHLLNAR